MLNSSLDFAEIQAAGEKMQPTFDITPPNPPENQ